MDLTGRFSFDRVELCIGISLTNLMDPEDGHRLCVERLVGIGLFWSANLPDMMSCEEVLVARESDDNTVCKRKAADRCGKWYYYCDKAALLLDVML